MKNFLVRLWKDEDGQSMTEYLLVLGIVVMIAIKFKDMFKPMMEKAVNSVGTQIDTAVGTSNQ